jgi:hypothetical protein
MLLAAFDERRPTGDVDLLARSIANDVERLSDIVRQLLAMPVDDGVTFDIRALRADAIRDAELYSGVRIVIPAGIETAGLVRGWRLGRAPYSHRAGPARSAV